jgi:catechol 2,3-dioxygenase-like lactoylglutathione lyase family enzyme
MQNIVKRTTLIVRSVERSKAFYAGVLGMSVYYDDEIELGGVGLPATSKGDRTHLVIMKCADPVIGMIGLLEFTDPRKPEPAAPKRGLSIGDIVFVMQGDDAQGVYERLQACGARIQSAPHAYEVKGADGRVLKMTMVSFWDPDDYFIEYNQRHD